MKALRGYQSTAIDLVHQAMAEGHRRVMLMLPTGGGKTLIATWIIKRALAKGKRVVFAVKGIELIDQTIQAFAKEGITDVGVIQADHHMTDHSRPVQVASIDTLLRHRQPEADLVIVDEAHIASKFIFAWMKNNPRLAFIGLSATPWTKGLGKHYETMVIASTTQQLIREGYLSPYRVFAPSHPDLSGVRTLAGDYREDDLAEAMDKPTLTADVVSTWIKLGESRQTLCFAVNRAHARSLQRDFAAANVPTAYVDGDTDRAERKVIREAFERGDVKVVVNVGVLTTGVDWDVRCIILARPTKSEMLFVQIIGRGLRTADGKHDCLILDHSDSTLNLGFPADIHHDRLSDGTERKSSSAARKERPAPLPKECPSCSRLKPAGVHKCPSCGFEPKRIQDVETRQGELAQLGGKQLKATMEDKQRWYSMLIGYARNHGQKEGSAFYRFKDRFGVEPATSLRKVAINPNAEVVSFVKHCHVKRVKQREKEQKLRDARHAS